MKKTVRARTFHCAFKVITEQADDSSRRVPVVVSTDELVEQSDWDGDYLLKLEHSPEAVDLTRAPLPLQEEHTNGIPLGIVSELETSTRDDGVAVLRGQLEMGQSSRAVDLWPDVKNGIIRNVSVGAFYSTDAISESIENGVRHRTVSAWQPYHVALVGSGANPSARIESTLLENSSMTLKKTEGAQAGDNAAAASQTHTINTELAAKRAAELAVAEERKRVSEIRLAVRTAQLGDEFADELINAGTPSAEAHKRIIEKWAELGGAPTRGISNVQIQADAVDKMREGVTEWLSFRTGQKGAQLSANNEFRNYSLKEIMRAMLHVRGISTAGASETRMLELGYHGQSDFKAVVEDIANKSLMEGFQGAEETWQTWCQSGTNTDFKPNSRVEFGMFNSLDEVPRGAEITHTTTADRSEKIQLATYSNLFSLDYQTIVDDDVNSFSRIPEEMGRASAHTIGDLVYLHALTGTDPMSDGNPLFDATHNNIMSAEGITTDSVDTMGTAMALQTATGADQRVLRLNLAYLVVPRTLRGTARVVADSQFRVGGAGDLDNTVPNSVRDTFMVVAEPRLDGLSTTAWYGAASNRTIEVAFLNGQQAPSLESWEGMTILGMTWRVVLHVAAKALDWRTLAYNPGA